MNNSVRHGNGTQKFSNGSIYEGEWKNNQANGKGRLTFKNGDYYDGEWVNNQAEGHGTFVTYFENTMNLHSEELKKMEDVPCSVYIG